MDNKSQSKSSFIESLMDLSEEIYSSAKKKIQEDEDFIVENWYHLLKSYTATTHFITLSFEEIESIILYYRYAYLDKKELSEINVEILKSLNQKLKKTHKKDLSSESFFVRLSMRSPKDGASYENKNKIELLKHEYDILKKKWNPQNWQLIPQEDEFIEEKISKLSDDEIEANFKLISYFKYSDKHILKCNSSEDAMNLILSSERVFVDLLNFLKYSYNYKNHNDSPIKKFQNINISIRQWVNLDSSLEFRCFVKGNMMTAISQYNPYIIVEELLNNDFLMEIRSKILIFWGNNIKEKLLFLNEYVIDIALIDNSDLYVIELNPFVTTTSSGFFDWTIDKDLLEGKISEKGRSIVPIIRVRNFRYKSLINYLSIIDEEISNYENTKNFVNVLESINSQKSCLIY